MKKTTKSAQRLLLSTSTVRNLQPLDETQLRAAAGGRGFSGTDGETDVGACPQSVVPHPE